MLGSEFIVAFEIQISFALAHRKKISELWTDTSYSRFEVAKFCAVPTVASKLVVVIAN